MAGDRFDFELDHEIRIGAVTAHGGAPVLLEHFRVSGAAGIVDAEVSYKRRKRGLTASETMEILLALWPGTRSVAAWDDDFLASLIAA